MHSPRTGRGDPRWYATATASSCEWQSSFRRRWRIWLRTVVSARPRLDRDLPGRDAVCEQLQHFVLAWAQAARRLSQPVDAWAWGRRPTGPVSVASRDEA